MVYIYDVYIIYLKNCMGQVLVIDFIQCMLPIKNLCYHINLEQNSLDGLVFLDILRRFSSSSWTN